MDTLQQQNEIVCEMVLRRLETIRMPHKRWLTPEEAARYLSFDVKHLHKLRRLGRGPKCVRKGSRVIRWDVAELDRWIASEAGDE